MGRTNARWYLVRTKQHKEALARNLLSARIPESFLPLLRTRCDYIGDAGTRLIPLFPCYVFAFFDLHAQYQTVQRTPGVNGLICAGNEPSEVAQEIIDEIRRRGRDGIVELPRTTLQPGELVNVRRGPLRGISAVFERYLSGAERAAVLINSLGGSGVRLIVPAALIEPTANRTYQSIDSVWRL